MNTVGIETLQDISGVFVRRSAMRPSKWSMNGVKALQII
jgi:hypothetical protein